MKKVTCAGCKVQHNVDRTSFYRRKRWCGDQSCISLIDENVKSINYKKKQRKINSGSYRQGVDRILREKILLRDSYRCGLCGLVDTNYGVIQVHHIVPVSFGGKDDDMNLICLCRYCHTTVHVVGWENYVLSFEKNLAELGGCSISFS
jgi:5-methylcytosine-specific restriction protein A